MLKYIPGTLLVILSLKYDQWQHASVLLIVGLVFLMLALAKSCEAIDGEY